MAVNTKLQTAVVLFMVSLVLQEGLATVLQEGEKGHAKSSVPVLGKIVERKVYSNGLRNAPGTSRFHPQGVSVHIWGALSTTMGETIEARASCPVGEEYVSCIGHAGNASGGDPHLLFQGCTLALFDGKDTCRCFWYVTKENVFPVVGMFLKCQ